MKPLVPQLKSYIKDDWDFLRKLPSEIPYDCDLYTCDVVSLYTSIDHDLGLQALQYWLNKLRHLIPSRFTPDFILESASFVLKNNCFLFDEVLYQQRVGTAMGTGFAPPYACLTVGFLEVTKFYPEIPLHVPDELCNLIIELFVRYIDDGFIPWPKQLDINILKSLLNNLDKQIKFTIEPAYQETLQNGLVVKKINFLDICVILHDSRKVETDIFYKATNTHEYLHYTSQHPIHTKNNIPFGLAKRIIVFCSDALTEQKCLHELREWLLRCDYPPKIIDKAFHNAKLQGPAPAPKEKGNTLPLVTTNYANYNCNYISQLSNKLLTSSNSERIIEVFGSTNTVLALKQPPNILTKLSRAKFVSQVAIPPQPGFFKCTDSRCILCRDYFEEGDSFVTAHGTVWKIKCHVTCHSLNVLYYLKCIHCNSATTYTGKTNNLRKRMNNHISSCRTGETSDLFDQHVFICKDSSPYPEEPFFKINIFMEVSHTSLLLPYESHLHKKKLDTMN